MSERPSPVEIGLFGGFLLLVATGFVDAYVFLQHGHVFAQAMTGNLVLIGIGVFEPSVIAFWLPLVAYLAFVLGVAAVWAFSRTRSAVLPRHESGPQLATLILQTAVLIMVGFLSPSFPQVVVIAAIAFASGLQIASFQRVGGTAFTTTVMTSNSMRMINAGLTALRSRDPDDIATARSLLIALGGFVVGLFAGALASSLIADRAAWIGAGLYALVGVLYLLARPTAPEPRADTSLAG